MYLRRDAANVKAGSTEGATFLDAGGLEAQLRGLDRGHIATGAATNNHDVVLIRSG